MDINQAVIIITGAASGLGAEAGKVLHDGGARVVLADINHHALQTQASALGARALAVQTDVSDERNVADLIAQAQAFGTLRGLVQCAGIAHGERVVGKHGVHDLADFSRVLSINVVGVFNVLRMAALAMSTNPPLADGERGLIINTASVAAFDGQIGQAAYSASKGAVVSMTLPIARELAKWGIRVMAIAPGIFETPMMAGMSDDIKHSLSAQVPYPSRLGRPHEFAQLVAHLFANAYLNGEVIRLDGAMRMGAH